MKLITLLTLTAVALASAKGGMPKMPSLPKAPTAPKAGKLPGAPKMPKPPICYDTDKNGKDFVVMLEADGKYHRHTLFIQGEEDSTEFDQFLHGRLLVAMDPNLTVSVKTGYDMHDGLPSVTQIKDVPECEHRSKAFIALK